MQTMSDDDVSDQIFELERYISDGYRILRAIDELIDEHLHHPTEKYTRKYLQDDLILSQKRDEIVEMLSKKEAELCSLKNQ